MVRFPAHLTLEALCRGHRRAAFSSGQALVDGWLHGQALQSQTKRLSATRVLAQKDGALAGYYTLAMGQVDFGDLPSWPARSLVAACR